MNAIQLYLFALLLLLASATRATENHLTFSQTCTPGNQIVVAAVGDLLLHRPLQVKAAESGYASLWQDALPFIQAADIAYANLEGPIAAGMQISGRESRTPLAWDANVYTGYPLFNYHPSLGQALKDSGFDIVSTANNHSLDRSFIGVDKTIDVLNEASVKYVGTRKRDSETSWVEIIEAKGIKVAWLSCAEHTNGNSDRFGQVLRCYQKENKALILETIQKLKSSVDAIIVTPHWGDEYQRSNNRSQEIFAHDVLDAGATAVIGSHPHVLQPVEKYLAKDGRETLIAYSLGNFVSYQSSLDKRASLLLLLGLTKSGARTAINGVRFVPLFMENRAGVKNIQLTMLNEKKGRNSPAFATITRSIPEANAIFSLPIVTNPECKKPGF